MFRFAGVHPVLRPSGGCCAGLPEREFTTEVTRRRTLCDLDFYVGWSASARGHCAWIAWPAVTRSRTVPGVTITRVKHEDLSASEWITVGAGVRRVPGVLCNSLHGLLWKSGTNTK